MGRKHSEIKGGRASLSALWVKKSICHRIGELFESSFRPLPNNYGSAISILDCYEESGFFFFFLLDFTPLSKFLPLHAVLACMWQKLFSHSQHFDSLEQN